MSTQGAHGPITAAVPLAARQGLDGQQAVKREVGGIRGGKGRSYRAEWTESFQVLLKGFRGFKLQLGVC